MRLALHPCKCEAAEIRFHTLLTPLACRERSSLSEVSKLTPRSLSSAMTLLRAPAVDLATAAASISSRTALSAALIAADATASALSAAAFADAAFESNSSTCKGGQRHFVR